MSDIEKLLSMTYEECVNTYNQDIEYMYGYEECVNTLLKKYGHAKKDYFCTPECKSANPLIKRTK